MTTSQTYRPDDDQLVQAHDHATSEDNLIEPEASVATAEPDLAEPDLAEPDLAEPDADLVTAEPDLAEPDADLVTAEPDLAEPDADLVTAEPDLAEPDADPMAPDSDLTEASADKTADEDPTSHPADAVALADSEPATSMVSGYPGFIPHGNGVGAEPEIAQSGSGTTSLISEAFTVPESDPDAHPAGDTTRSAGPWNEVQAMFVDDPRASIERAAGLVDDRVEELIHSLRERQRSMQSAWQASEAGTEELRVALQHYRTFWNNLKDLPAPV